MALYEIYYIESVKGAVDPPIPCRTRHPNKSLSNIIEPFRHIGSPPILRESKTVLQNDGENLHVEAVEITKEAPFQEKTTKIRGQALRGDVSD